MQTVKNLIRFAVVIVNKYLTSKIGIERLIPYRAFGVSKKEVIQYERNYNMP